MNREDLKRLTLLGIAGGLFLSAQAQAGYQYQESQPGRNPMAGRNGCGGKNGCGGHGGETSSNDRMQMQGKSQEESAFYAQLGPEGKRMWNNLSFEGRQLALRLSRQYSDKNQAVREAQKQMDAKSPTGPSGPQPQGTRGGRYAPIALNDEGEVQSHDSNMDEKTFYSQLSADSKKIWDSLDAEGRQLAIRLSKQYNDKNQAVREAQKQMETKSPMKMSPQPSSPQGMRGWRSSPIAEGGMQTQDMNSNMDEKTFYSQLSADSKKIWDTLDAEGRQLAIRLSKQYNDKNQAVREAQKQVNQRAPQSGPMRNPQSPMRAPSQQEGARNAY